MTTMPTMPRFDDHIIYLIPVDLYSDILGAIGEPYAALICMITADKKQYAEQTGGECKNLLDLLHGMNNQRGDLLADCLYREMEGAPEPEPPELQEV